MLRVSVHAGPLKDISRFNRTDWLEISYDRLRAVADYHVMLFTAGCGAGEPAVIQAYPRWSASLWDLVARAIAVTLFPKSGADAVPPVANADKRPAFAECLSAVIAHFGGRAPPGGRRIAELEIRRHGRRRGLYRATVHEDLFPSRSTLPFTMAPSELCHAELVMRAALMRLTGTTATLAPRPALRLPPRRVIDGKPFVALHQLREPARSGFARWLYRCSEAPREHPSAPDGIAPETMFAKFLEEAV